MTPAPAPGPLASPPTDDVLLAQHARGDRDAFAELVRRYARLVYASCRRQVGSVDVDDACQAVFLVLARKPSQAARAPSVAAWLLRVAWHVCARARRARARRTRAELEAAAVTAPAPDHGARPEALAHLDELLASLPAHERDVLVLHVMEGVDQEELARRLGIAHGTVRSRLSRGLARLRERFERRGIAMSIAALATLMAQEAHASPPPELLARAADADAGTDDASIDALARAGEHGLRPLAPTLAIAGAATLAAGLCAASWWWEHEPAPTAHAPTAPITTTLITLPAPAVATAAGAMPTTMDQASALLPEDAHISARAVDIDRTLLRLRATPYAALLARPNARPLIDRLQREAPQLAQWDPRRLRGVAMGLRFEHPGVDAFDRLMQAQAEGSALSLLPDLTDYTVVLLGRDGGMPGLERALGSAFGIAITPGTPQRWNVDGQPWGSLRLHDGDLVVSDRPVAKVLASPRAVPLGPTDPDADLEFVTHRPFEAQGSEGLPGWYAVAFDANGATSRIELRDGAAAMPATPTDLDAVRKLPSDTLFALSRHCTQARVDVDATLAVALLTTAIGDRGTGADAAPADQGRPAWIERLGVPAEIVLDGEAMLYVRAGAPLPSVTARLGMTADDGRSLLASLGRALAVEPDADGVVSGVVGPVPFAAAWRDGRLLLTTHPEGIDAALGGDAGFGAHADVGAALASVPAEAYAVCVARTEAWAFGAQYLSVLAPMLPDAEAKALLALPADLRAVCGSCQEVVWSTAGDGVRRTVARGPVLGLIGPLLDPGGGDLPLPSLWN